MPPTDSRFHSELTRKSNDLVLANARLVARIGVTMVCWVPSVLGINEQFRRFERNGSFC